MLGGVSRGCVGGVSRGCVKRVCWGSVKRVGQEGVSRGCVGEYYFRKVCWEGCQEGVLGECQCQKMLGCVLGEY